jgi:hypothetical protein
MKQSEWAPGVLEQFHEQSIDLYDYITCIRGDGSYYGNGGTKCVKGSPATKKDLAAEKKKAKAGDPAAAKKVKQMEKTGVAGPAPKVPKAPKSAAKSNGGSAPAASKSSAKAPTDADREKAMADVMKKKKAYTDAVKKGQTAKAAKIKADLEKARAKVEALKTPEQKKKAADALAKSKAADKVEQIAAKAARANKAKRPPKVEISEDARKAINTYTKDTPGPPADFQKMNRAARSGKGDAATKANIAAFDKALNELPANTGGKSHFRGIAANPTLARQMANLKPGDSFSDKGFGSYSRDPGTASAFTRGSKNSVVIESRSKSLRGVEQFSKIKSEQEAVLPRGTNQTVREVRQEGNVTYVVVD